MSAARRSIAAWTSAALAIRSERSRKPQAVSSSGMDRSLAFLQVAREVAADLGMTQAELDLRLHVAELRAAVVALARQAHREHALVFEQRGNAVGELDLAARAGRDLRQHLEDARRQNVAADHAEIGRRRRGLRLLDDAVDARGVALHLVDGHDAVALRLVARHLFHAE